MMKDQKKKNRCRKLKFYGLGGIGFGGMELSFKCLKWKVVQQRGVVFYDAYHARTSIAPLS